MKKKISVVACAIVLIVVSVFFAGCSCNEKIFDFNYKYTHCLVKEGDEWGEYVVKSWKDYDDGTITIWTSDGQMIFTHTNNVVMYGEG